MSPCTFQLSWASDHCQWWLWSLSLASAPLGWRVRLVGRLSPRHCPGAARPFTRTLGMITEASQRRSYATQHTANPIVIINVRESTTAYLAVPMRGEGTPGAPCRQCALGTALCALREHRGATMHHAGEGAHHAVRDAPCAPQWGTEARSAPCTSTRSD